MPAMSASLSTATGTDLNARSTALPVAVWLTACCGMVVPMMLIGAITRLTESGLSMVEWSPLMGVVGVRGRENAPAL